MTELEAAVIERRLIAMRELLDHLMTLDGVTAQALRSDVALRLQVTMALAQVITLAAEVNAHVVRHVTGSAPTDMRTGFTAMAEAGWLDSDTAAALTDAPGMRNVIIHQYVDVDLQVVAAAVPLTAIHFDAYVRTVAGNLPTV